MSVASDHVAVFRNQWADRFVDACDVRRLASRGAINTTTLKYPSESEPDVVAGQACLYRPDDATPEVNEFGQQGISRLDGMVHFPHDAPELQVEDTIVVTASEKSPKIVGKTLRVTGVHFDSYQTHMWVDVELDQGPGESI